MYDRILLPVDGSEEAEQAARGGLELAEQFDAAVDLLHVVPQKALRLAVSADEKTQLRERGQTVLTEIENDALTRGFEQPLTTTLREGEPATEISEYAAVQDTDLIVIGRQGVSGIKKRLLGGVTEQVLHQAECPVFVVPADAQTVEMDSEYTRLLLPTDGSERAEAAIPHGITLAQQYETSIEVLNVVDLQAAGGTFSAGGLRKEFVERLEAAGREAIERAVDEIKRSDPDLDVETAVERTVSFKGAAAGIRDHVADTDCDLVVMGSHGRSNLKRQLLGSVAASVLRSVDLPVLVVTRQSAS